LIAYYAGLYSVRNRRKTLSEWLERIGAENCPEASFGADGTVKIQSNDEALARLLWRQALGYVETVTDINGQVIRQQAHAPDRNSQQIILERREGKPATIDADESATPKLMDRLSQAIIEKLNKAVKDVPNNSNS